MYAIKPITQEELANIVLRVDVVNAVDLIDILKPGDLITHINNRPFLDYMLETVAFSERKTNALLYNLQKTALRLGIFNHFFPV